MKRIFEIGLLVLRVNALLFVFAGVAITAAAVLPLLAWGLAELFVFILSLGEG